LVCTEEQKSELSIPDFIITNHGMAS